MEFHLKKNCDGPVKYRCHKQINDILIAPVTISIGFMHGKRDKYKYT